MNTENALHVNIIVNLNRIEKHLSIDKVSTKLKKRHTYIWSKTNTKPAYLFIGSFLCFSVSLSVQSNKMKYMYVVHIFRSWRFKDATFNSVFSF